MADQPSQKGKTGKLLGMPRTTGLIVIGLGALVAGYLVISHFSSSKSSGASSGKGGGHGGGPGWGSGQHAVVRVIREHHGHGHGGGEGQPVSDQGEVFSRDTSTLADDGPDLAAYESPSARHGNPHAGQQEAENQAQRPHFSPVAQPGMTEEIHWGTVRRDQVNHGEGGHHERPSHGMFHRLHQEHGGGKHHGHGH